jgi:hypothetical protein
MQHDFFAILHFTDSSTSKPFFMSIDPKKKSFWSIWHEKWFFSILYGGKPTLCGENQSLERDFKTHFDFV